MILDFYQKSIFWAKFVKRALLRSEIFFKEVGHFHEMTDTIWFLIIIIHNSVLKCIGLAIDLDFTLSKSSQPGVKSL